MTTNDDAPVELVWEAPPAKPDRLGMYEEVIPEIERRPGQWARLRVFETTEAGYSASSSLKTRLTKRDPRWQVRVARLAEGGAGLYVRFRNDAQMREEEKK